MWNWFGPGPERDMRGGVHLAVAVIVSAWTWSVSIPTMSDAETNIEISKTLYTFI